MADDERPLMRLAAQFSQAFRTGELVPSVQVRVALAEGRPDHETETDSTRETTEAEEKTKTEEAPSLKRTLGEQLSIGGVLGFATGYSIRKIGKALMFVVGTEVVILQYMAYREWLVMDWSKLARDVSPTFTRSALDKLMAILVYKMPFNVAFTGGLFAGLRLSAPPPK